MQTIAVVKHNHTAYKIGIQQHMHGCDRLHTHAERERECVHKQNAMTMGKQKNKKRQRLTETVNSIQEGQNQSKWWQNQRFQLNCVWPVCLWFEVGYGLCRFRFSCDSLILLRFIRNPFGCVFVYVSIHWIAIVHLLACMSLQYTYFYQFWVELCKF